jgi:hypothetical protein
MLELDARVDAVRLARAVDEEAREADRFGPLGLCKGE